MAFPNPSRTWVAGETVTAAHLNGEVRDAFNETAPAKATTAGDMFYATAARTLARLGIGTAGQTLKVNSGATAPEWGLAGPDVYARVRHNATQGAGALAMNTEDYDSDGAHDTVTNNSRLTCPTSKGGIYLIGAHVEVSDDQTSQRTRLRLRINGTTNIASSSAPTDTLFASNLAMTVVTIWDMVPTDYVEAVLDVNTSTQTVDSTASYSPCLWFMRVIPQ